MDQKRLEMSMQEFVDRWVNSEDHDGSLLYLKDWHFVKVGCYTLFALAFVKMSVS
jgi:hypothetical protein